jgi:DNA polymerase (family 10)
MLSNRAVADIFAAIADSMELLGEDRFRALAYRKAANAIAELPLPLADYRARDALDDIPGVGKVIAEKIGTVLDTDTLPLYERLRKEVPAGVLDLLRVPEIGPRSARRLQTELGIASLDDLRAAIEAGKLRELKGFGGKTEARILAGLSAVESQEKRMLMSTALAQAEPLLEALRAMPGVRTAAYAGSLRRARPTIGDIDLLAASDDAPATIEAFTKLPQVAQVFSQGGEKASVQLHSGAQLDLLVVEPHLWGSALQHFSSGKAHSIHFRNLALARGLSFSEHGFIDTATGQPAPLPVETEEQVYAAIGLPLIPPELREDKGELEAAQEGRLPTLVELSDIRADLHMHSTWSDGRATVAAMAEAARARGYQYMAIADHSAYLGVTGGLDAARLRQQAEEVRALNDDYVARGIDFRVLRGVEVDITPDGSLALPDEALAELDIVVASPHVSLRQERAAATARLLKAIANPHVDIIGHPTGRLLERREGSDLDMDAIFHAAAANGTLLEVNSGPDRLDLDAIYARRALELGCTLVVDSDAHAPADLGWMRLGVLTARRGWASAEQVANTWPLERLLKWLQDRSV